MTTDDMSSRAWTGCAGPPTYCATTGTPPTISYRSPSASCTAAGAGRATLLDLLARLTPRRRAAVVLRFYFDLTVEETADMLGCSTGTVKSLTSRGLEAMRARAVELANSGTGETP
jgi:DNA-directed RNA polymerase specialized sigma24 family protein